MAVRAPAGGRPTDADRRLVAQWSRHPATFLAGVLRAKMWPGQIAICDAITRPRARVAVKGCHASTKTFTAAGLVVWWTAADPNNMAITTAPTWKQVRRVMWTEVRRQAQVVAFPRMTQTSIELDDHNFAVGISTNDATRLQGFHGKILIVIDEAPGVMTDLFEGIEGIRAVGDVRMLLLGNPTVPGGPFYDAFHGGDAQSTKQITLSAMDTPNLAGIDLDDLVRWPVDDPRLDVQVYPYTVSRRWVYEAYHKWGPDSPAFLARVLGEFPRQQPGAVYSLGDLEAARREPEPEDLAGAVYAGIDVAGAGRDSTVLVVRAAAGGIMDVQEWSDADSRGKAIDVLKRYGRRLRNVNVDATGIGYFYARTLRDAKLPVTDVTFSSSPRGTTGDGRALSDRRAEVAWSLRVALAGGRVSGLGHPGLDEAWSDLAALRYGQDAAGKIALEPKDKWKKRLPGGRSPDAAEALMLAYDNPEVSQFGGQPTGGGTRQMQAYRPRAGGARVVRPW